MNILHFASFVGNIGDNANHYGLYKCFNKKFGNENYKIHEEEIREYYWKNKKFDESIIDKFNQFDLIIIGGGNYFELWVENSRTGTSIDLPIEYLKKIKPPILFFSLGVDIHQGIYGNNIEKFRTLLSYLIADSNSYVSIRNDGALNNLTSIYDELFTKNINVIPDSGILLSKEDVNNNIKLKKQTIGINLAGDMLNIRYLNYNKTIKKLANYVSSLSMDYDIIFIPHIIKDLKIIMDVINEIPEEIVRKRIQIAPLMSGYEGMKNIFGIYQQCKIILANRFHSNLCSIGLGVPTIGLVNYPQISNLYKELELTDNTIDLNNDFFVDKLNSKIEYISLNHKRIKANSKNTATRLKKHHAERMDDVFEWINTKFEGLFDYN